VKGPYRNRAHQGAFAAGQNAGTRGLPRSAPYEPADASMNAFRHAWLEGYDQAVGDALPSTRETRAVEQLMQAQWRFEAAHERMDLGTTDRAAHIMRCAEACAIAEKMYRKVMKGWIGRWKKTQPCNNDSPESKNAAPGDR
jgi:hypothetical protein